MFRYSKYNPNPYDRSVGDCVVRALSKALDQSWDKTYIDICLEGYLMGDMPSANAVWGAYLKTKGFKRHLIDDKYPHDYTVEQFCNDHPRGTYVLALSTHIVCVIDGTLYDSWQSGNEIVIYCWLKED